MFRSILATAGAALLLVGAATAVQSQTPATPGTPQAAGRSGAVAQRVTQIPRSAIMVDGGEALPVGRLAFKAREGRQTALSGFDSHSLPPTHVRHRPRKTGEGLHLWHLPDFAGRFFTEAVQLVVGFKSVACRFYPGCGPECLCRGGSHGVGCDRFLN